MLVTISKLIAPFTPFVAEDIHVNLTGNSVHLEDYPVVNESLLQPKLEAEMNAVYKLLNLEEVTVISIL